MSSSSMSTQPKVDDQIVATTATTTDSKTTDVDSAEAKAAKRQRTAEKTADNPTATSASNVVGGGPDLDSLFAESPLLSEKDKILLRKFFSKNETVVKVLREELKTNEVKLKLKEDKIQTGGETVRETLSLQLIFEPFSWKKTKKVKKGVTS